MSSDSQRAAHEARHTIATSSQRLAEHEDNLQRYLLARAEERPRRGYMKPSGDTGSEDRALKGQVPERLVVVGVASAASFAAVDQAAVEASLRGWPLRILQVQHPSHPTLHADRRDRGAALLEEMSDRARAQATAISVDADLEVGSIAQTLICRTATAGLLVLGGRRRSPVSDLMWGSVGADVAAHAVGPVALVRVPSAPYNPEAPRPVVVCVDGSPAADAAAAFAADEARLRGVPLLAVHVAADEAAYWDDRRPDPLRTGALDPATGSVTGLTVLRRRADGPVRESLTDASVYAAVVVVGAGHGPQLGSTSRALVRDAHCPVFVIHPASRPASVASA